MFTLHPQLKKDGIAVGDLSLCRVLLINDRQYPWFVLVPMCDGISEIIDLTGAQQQLLWQESARFSQLLKSVYRPDKLNVAALGNMVPQLHIHHVVRFTDDVAWPAPIWGRFPLIPYDEQQIAAIKAQILPLL